jgi:hypothetical protein
VLWKVGSTYWVSLKDLKQSHPVEVADYAVANKISEEPAFAWRVRKVLRKRNIVIKKVKSSKYWARAHRYGVRIPKSVKEALRIDNVNGNTLCHDAISKETKNVGIAYFVPDSGQSLN